MAKKTVAQMREEARAQLTVEMLRDNVTWHPTTGEFWTKPRRIGTVQYFGRKKRDPAVTLTLKGKDGKWRKYYAHILAWLWMTGEWPREEIDHRNTDPLDNRWANLREATHTENNRNKDFRGRNKFVGASFHKASGLWRATLKRKTLGYFRTPKEAHEAYKRAAIALYGAFAHSSLTLETGAAENPLDKDSGAGFAADKVESGQGESD